VDDELRHDRRGCDPLRRGREGTAVLKSLPDALFADPRLAALYDTLEADRPDLDAYAAIVDELEARRVLDVGCGTGTLACMLAGRGLDVIGIDPASASLAIARRKSDADRVTWIEAGAAGAPPVEADLAVMTGNVAQVFLTDRDWLDAIVAVRAALRPGGWFVFEVRDPARRAWEGWTAKETERRLHDPLVGRLRTWTELTDVRLPFVSFRQVVELAGGDVLVSDSTLRFRDEKEVAESLERAGFAVVEVRDAPDRPGLELVFVARRRESVESAP
jgi:SAM-dependent methyltransferase